MALANSHVTAPELVLMAHDVKTTFRIARSIHATGMEIARMKSMTPTGPNVQLVYRCGYKGCRSLLNPHELERSVRVHFAQSHRDLQEPLEVQVVKWRKPSGKFVVPASAPQKKGKVGCNKSKNTAVRAQGFGQIVQSKIESYNIHIVSTKQKVKMRLIF